MERLSSNRIVGLVMKTVSIFITTTTVVTLIFRRTYDGISLHPQDKDEGAHCSSVVVIVELLHLFCHLHATIP